MYNIEGNAQAYGYLCLNVSDLNVTIDSIVKYNYLEVFEKPKVVGKQSFLSIRLDKLNNIEEIDQEILIIFCPDKKCSYRIIFTDNVSIIKLKQYETMSLQILGTQYLELDLAQLKEKETGTLTMCFETFVYFESFILISSNSEGKKKVLKPIIRYSSSKTFFHIKSKKKKQL